MISKGAPLQPDQLRALGALPLTELRLESFAFRQQPTLSRPALGHVTNDGVRALVDAICARMAGARGERGVVYIYDREGAVQREGETGRERRAWRPLSVSNTQRHAAHTLASQHTTLPHTWQPRHGNAVASPLRLSLAGAAGLNHEAVSALLRLPALTELDINGCARITPMDKVCGVCGCVDGSSWLCFQRR